MVCPFCLHKKTEVYNTRNGARLNSVWRRRQCAACGKQFTTYENADPSTVLTIKDGKKRVPFSHTKLLLSLLYACDHRRDTDKSVPHLAYTVEQKLYSLSAAATNTVITKDIVIAITAETLQNYDPVAFVKYTSRHQTYDAKSIRRALKPAR